MSKAHDFPQVYKDLGYDLSLLGCIMLNVNSQDDQQMTDGLEDLVDQAIPEDQRYYAKDKKRFWIQGSVVNKAHVTLLYGLLRTSEEMKKHVDAVLDGAIPKSISVDHVGYFDSPYDDEPYYCIVAHLTMTDELIEANERLKFLPHINTFPGYKAHFTLAYIKKEEALRDKIIDDLNVALGELSFKTGELDYGGNKS